MLANGIFLPGPITVEGVLIPKPEVNEFPLPNSPWEPKGLKELRKSAESGEIAVKPKLLFSIDSNHPSYDKNSDGLVSRDLYQSVIGIDRTFFTNLYVNLQFFTDLIEDGQESLASKRKTHGITYSAHLN